MKTYQDYIDIHHKWGPQEHTEKTRFIVLAICGEAGELANLVKKQWRDCTPHQIKKIKKEMAVIGNYLNVLADHLGVDLQAEMLKKMVEVSKRKTFKKAMKSKHVCVENGGCKSMECGE